MSEIKKENEYQSQWQDSINQAMDKILNREKFSYDLNGDALYQQYKNQYMKQGKQAMMDTVGMASSMTGGYGNSYAQTAGQQTFQGYLEGLNDKIPELYSLARSAYDSDTDDLYKQYSVYLDRDETDYGRFRDDVSDQQWQTEFDENVKRFLAQAAPDVRAYYEAYGKLPEDTGTSSDAISGGSTGGLGSIVGGNSSISGGSYAGTSTSGGGKSISQIAQEVVAGKWGNGTARKNALEKAGYDYATVQAAVNKLMNGVKADTTPTAPKVDTGKVSAGDYEELINALDEYRGDDGWIERFLTAALNEGTITREQYNDLRREYINVRLPGM